MKDPDLDLGHTVISTFDRGNHAIIDKDWRYIRYADGEEELYSTRDDPNEWNNLVRRPEYQARLESLRRRLPASSSQGN